MSFLSLYNDCFFGDYDKVQSLLQIESIKESINNNYKGITPLIATINKGHKSVFELLIENKADVNSPENISGNPPINTVLQYHKDNDDLKEYFMNSLLKHKADINKGNNNGQTPLYIISCTGDIKMLRLLIQNKADINKTNVTGITPLYSACFRKQKEILKILIENKADINAQEDTKKNSPLFMSAGFGNTEIVKILLESNKCNTINTPDIKGQTPIYGAASKGYKDIVQLLIDHQANINTPEVTSHTPIFVAAQQGYKDTVEILMCNGADINISNKHGTTPLAIARRLGKHDVVEVLSNPEKYIEIYNQKKKNQILDSDFDGPSFEAETEIGNFLKENNLNMYIANFEDNGFDDIEDCLDLSEEELIEELNIKNIDHVDKILNLFKALNLE